MQYRTREGFHQSGLSPEEPIPTAQVAYLNLRDIENWTNSLPSPDLAQKTLVADAEWSVPVNMPSPCGDAFSAPSSHMGSAYVDASIEVGHEDLQAMSRRGRGQPSLMQQRPGDNTPHALFPAIPEGDSWVQVPRGDYVGRMLPPSGCAHFTNDMGSLAISQDTIWPVHSSAGVLDVTTSAAFMAGSPLSGPDCASVTCNVHAAVTQPDMEPVYQRNANLSCNGPQRVLRPSRYSQSFATNSQQALANLMPSPVLTRCLSNPRSSQFTGSSFSSTSPVLSAEQRPLFDSCYDDIDDLVNYEESVLQTATVLPNADSFDRMDHYAADGVLTPHQDDFQPHDFFSVESATLPPEIGYRPEENARSDPLYRAEPDENELYHCPYSLKEDCGHKSTPLKCVYDKWIDSHLRPFRCKESECIDIRFSSTACLLRHRREAHGMYGHGTKPFLCEYADCERSKEGFGFPRKWNKQDHMRRVHNHTGPISDQPGIPTRRVVAMPRSKRAVESSSSSVIGALSAKSRNGTGRVQKKSTKASKAELERHALAKRAKLLQGLREQWSELQKDMNARFDAINGNDDAVILSTLKDDLAAMETLVARTTDTG